MEREGLDTRKISKTVDNLIVAKQALDFYKNKALYKHASFLSKNRCLISKQIFTQEAREIIFKFKKGLTIFKLLLYLVLTDIDDKPVRPLPLNNLIKKFSI